MRHAGRRPRRCGSSTQAGPRSTPSTWRRPWPARAIWKRATPPTRFTPGRGACSSTGSSLTRRCRARSSRISAIRAGTSGGWPTRWRGSASRAARRRGKPMTDPNAQPFAGVTVLEFGHFIAVPWAGQVLADGGAHVIKIEPLEGEPSRHIAPLGGGESRHFLIRNRGKHALPLDLRDAHRREMLSELSYRAHVV